MRSEAVVYLNGCQSVGSNKPQSASLDEATIHVATRRLLEKLDEVLTEIQQGVVGWRLSSTVDISDSRLTNEEDMCA